MSDDPNLTLDQQLCFALYAASRAAQAAYREILDGMQLTYPQWLVLLALWEQDGLGVTQLGDKLLLDSGTLSPLLRRMEKRGVVVRQRSAEDARKVQVILTDEGRALRARAGEVVHCLGVAMPLSVSEAATLRDLAHRLVEAVPASPETDLLTQETTEKEDV